MGFISHYKRRRRPLFSNLPGCDQNGFLASEYDARQVMGAVGFTRCTLLIAVVTGSLAIASRPNPSTFVVPPAQQDLAAKVAAFVEDLAARDEFAGSVLLSQHGKPLVRRGYGLADRERRRPNRPDTPFMLSSVGKMFTSIAVAMLIEQKRLSFDMTLGELVPDYPLDDARQHVTVRHLLTMSSGIHDLFRVPAFWSEVSTIKTPIAFWKYFASTPLAFRPGTQWDYSNSNFLLLGLIIERRTQRPFTAFVESEIFRRLKLPRTSYTVGSIPPALGYTRPASSGGARPGASDWKPAWTPPARGDGFVLAAAMGGGYSTVDDLGRFADALISHRLLGPEMTDRVLTGVIDTDYGGRDGYGFETHRLNGVRTAGHRGSLAGSSNQVEFYPDLGYVLVVLGNTDSAASEQIATHVRTLIASAQARPAVGRVFQGASRRD
jgi:CubicO group peptidase (beta-lactamase class C family)